MRLWTRRAKSDANHQGENDNLVPRDVLLLQPPAIWHRRMMDPDQAFAEMLNAFACGDYLKLDFECVVDQVGCITDEKHIKAKA